MSPSLAVTLEEIQAARKRIAQGVLRTPCVESAPLSELCDARVFCKLEYLQRTGSFKERGACNALQALSPEQRQQGVIAASAGNHALALAWHGSRFGAPVTVVMPKFAPLIKQESCRRFGANVVLHGETFAAAREEADRLCRAGGLTYVHGFDDPHIIAGQGTLGLEVLEDVPNAAAIIVPIGGAGLIAGVSVAVKALRPDVAIVGVEPANAASYSAAIAAGRPVVTDMRPTIADGLAVGKVGELAFSLARERVDRVVSVAEPLLMLSVVRLMELEKSVVEGAGAAPLAALLSGSLSDLRGKTVVLCLCGGNIDIRLIHRLVETTMVHDGRLARFTATISDRPGGLARLATLIAECGAGIQEIDHDRAFTGPDATSVNVLCTVETRNQDHVREVFDRLTASGIPHRRTVDGAT